MNQRTAKNTGWESGIQVATVPLILTIKLSYAGSCLVIKTSLMPSLMLARADAAPADDDVVIFEGVMQQQCGPMGDSVKVPKVEVATGTSATSYYAYWVEDEGVKVDLAGTRAVLPMRTVSRPHGSQPHPVLTTPFLLGLSPPESPIRWRAAAATLMI